MLYIMMIFVTLTWVIYLKKTKNISWHFLINTAAIGVMFVDIIEIIFNQLMGLYKFPTKFLSDPLKDNQLGVIFSDVLILPFTALLFTYFSSIYKKWKVTILFTVCYILMEVLFLKTGYIIYNKWSIWLSFSAYLIGFSFFSLFANRLVNYDPPIPYRIRLLSFTYSITAIIGGLLGGALIELYQWRPGVFEFPPADDRFADLGLSLILALMISTIIPFVLYKYKLLMFLLLTSIIVTFSFYASQQGWLIYHKWNHFLTAIKWFAPIIIVYFYDRWESNR